MNLSRYIVQSTLRIYYLVKSIHNSHSVISTKSCVKQRNWCSIKDFTYGVAKPIFNPVQVHSAEKSCCWSWSICVCSRRLWNWNLDVAFPTRLFISLALAWLKTRPESPSVYCEFEYSIIWFLCWFWRISQYYLMSYSPFNNEQALELVYAINKSR